MSIQFPQSPKVFIVDDEEWNVEVLTAVLLEGGFDASYESKVDEALAHLREEWRVKNLYDIIISDFYMPELDGHQFFLALEGYLGTDPTHSSGNKFKNFRKARKSDFCDKTLVEVLENCFTDYKEYTKFVEAYQEKSPLKILFSGRFHREMMVDPILRGRVRILQKQPDSSDRTCETAILEYLKSEGFLPGGISEAEDEIRYIKENGIFGSDFNCKEF